MTTQPKASPAGDPANLVGQVVDGRYAFKSVLGSGGMGTVYRAAHVTLERDVAIKVLQAQLAKEDTWIRRFMQEARAASRIRHPNVVEITDFGTLPDGSAYCVMELLEGRDLSYLLHEYRRLPWYRSRSILLQMVRGLGAAHACGVIHRDVKPANCFLVERGGPPPPPVGEGLAHDQIKMLDFGIAKVLGDDRSELTATNEIIGTATYMAPERASRGIADIRSDIYSVGIVAYKMLTGTVPFRGETSFATLTQHVNLAPPSMSAREPSITPSIERVILKSLAKRPEDRYQTMEEFGAALLSVDLQGVAVGPHVPSISIPVATPGPTRGRFEGSFDADSNTEADARLATLTESTREPQRPATSHAGVWLAVAGFVTILLAGAGLGAFYLWGPDASESPAGGEVAAATSDPTQLEAKPEEPVDEAIAGPDVPQADPAMDPASEEVEAAAAVTPEPTDTKVSRSGSTRRKSKSKSKPKPASDASVLKGLRRAARSKCGGSNSAGGADTVVVRFSIMSSGRASLPRASAPHEHSSLGKCVIGLVRAAKFPAGSMRAATLSVSF